MKDRAYAKINLALDVFAIRQDGYHDIKSIMVPVDFYDELVIRKSIEDEYHCSNPKMIFDESNSIVKMINAFRNKYNIEDHFRVDLKKVIPSQAGLGGGTSDAGCTLRILSKMYNMNLSKEDETQLCVSVGADVLFNYYSKPSVVMGIGDIVEPFNMRKQYYVLLVKPRKGVSTKQAYELLNMDVCDHPIIDKLKNALENGDDIKGLLGNSLEQPSLALNEEVNTIKQLLISNGASNVLMSGSGSCVFAISEDIQEIEKLNDIVKNSEYFTRLTKTI